MVRRFVNLRTIKTTINMKNKIILFVSAMVLGLICSCGQRNNSNQQWEMGDSDDPDPDEEVIANDKGFDFAFKFNKNGNLRLLYCTANKQEYYLFDDEHDYQGEAFLDYVVYETIQNIDKDEWGINYSYYYNRPMRELQAVENACIAKGIEKYSPYLKSVFDMPNVGNIPPSLKECFLKLYYDHQQSQLYIGQKRYGYQSYRINKNIYVTFERYKKQAGDGWDDIPDGAVMMYSSTSF